MKTTIIEPHKSSIGLGANFTSLIILAAMATTAWISFIGWFAWIVPLVFYFIEKESKFVKFQSIQALFIGVAWAVTQLFIWIIRPRHFYSMYYTPGRIVGMGSFWSIISTLVNVAFVLLIVYLVISAYNYKKVELPVIGPIADKASEK